MEISYKREMNHNYMVITPDWEGAAGYESRMMLSNPMDGVLKFRLKQTDNQPLFYYEITSRQPLDRVAEKRPVRQEQIRSLLLHIAEVQRNLEGYLIPEGRILLDPAYVYVDPDTFEAGLCVLPAYEGNFAEMFTQLLQYLMEKVDHQDKESVILAYRLYHESLKENYGIQRLMESLRRRSPADGGEEGREARTGGAEESHDREFTKELKLRPEYGGEAYGGRGAGREWPARAAFHGKEKEKTVDSPGKSTVLGETGTGEKASGDSVNEVRKKAVLFCGAGMVIFPAAFWFLWGWSGFLRYGIALAAAEAVVLAAAILLWITAGKFAGAVERAKIREIQRRQEEAKQWKVIFEETEEEPAPEEKIKSEGYTARSGYAGGAGTPPERGNIAAAEIGGGMAGGRENDTSGVGDSGMITEILADYSGEEPTAWLIPEDSGNKIEIPYVPFIIGKSRDMADGWLDRKTVSRLHARIDRTEGVYILTDLNSTNGTVVENYRLEANETVSIKDGDLVMLADARFHFKEKGW